MSCDQWEERVALYAGSDLAPVDAQAVERHVAGCVDCRAFLDGVRASLATVRKEHAEPVADAHFAAVRARVLGELQRRPAPRWRFAWVCALAGAFALLLLAWWPAPEERLVITTPNAPAAPAVAPVGAKRALRRPRKVEAKAAKPLVRPEPAEPLVVKLLTDDPNVVIYWITGTKGE
jgi:hypothetical protein